MRTSSTRLRMGAAVASTSLALVFSFGGQAFAGGADGNGSGRPVNTTPNDHPSGNDKTEESGGSGTQGKSSSDPDGQFNGGQDKPGQQGGFDADKDGNNGCGNDDDFEDDNNGNCGGPAKTKADREEKPEECVKASEMGQKHGKGKGKGLEGEKCAEDTDVKDEDDADDDTDAAPAVKVDEVKTEAVKTESVKTESTDNVVGTTVLGSIIENGSPAPQAAEAAQAAIETRVLGVSVERDTPAAVAAAPATAAPSTPTAVLGATFTRGAALARTGFGLTFLAIAGLLLILAGFGLKRSGRSTI